MFIYSQMSGWLTHKLCLVKAANKDFNLRYSRLYTVFFSAATAPKLNMMELTVYFMYEGVE